MTSLLDQLQSSFPSTYALEREVGRGGMATVFLARDVRYDRKVAVKVLSPELGAVLGVERFLSEIRVTATLQHPNLLPLFDSGESNGLLYYVMPFVEGETLRAKLDREKQLSVSETVRLGSAIASALDYAHRNGVIHRDLKPENILLQDGQPLVADFGIALAVSNAGGTRVTQTGLSLGTPQYMSPEQATGDRVIDARSDVYALGAILYECLTGEPPHTGTTAQAIIARLMTEEPRAISTTRKNVPAHVDAAIARALEKLPADRWASTKELADALQDPARITPPIASGSSPKRDWLRTRRVWAAVGLLAGAGITFASSLANPSRQYDDSSAVQLDVLPPPGVKIANPVGRSVDISADGRTVLFLGEDSTSTARRVYVRRLAETEAFGLAGSEFATAPVFAARGTSVVYRSPEGFRIHALDARSPRLLVRQAGGFTGIAWDVGDRFAFAARGLFTVDANGADRREVVSAGPGKAFSTVSNPYLFDGGKLIAFRATSGDEYRVATVPALGGEIRMLDTKFPGILGGVIGYQEGVLIIGMLDGTLHGLPFDVKSREARGEPVPLLENVSAKNQGGANAKVADNGTLVYVRGSPLRRVGIVAEDGRTVRALTEPGEYDDIRFSPDGQKLLVGRWENATTRSETIWLLDLRTGAFSRLLDGSGFDAQWAPDGKSVVFERDPPDEEGVFIAPIDGSEPVRKLFDGRFADPSFTPDGKALVMRRDSVGGPSRLVRASIDNQSDVKDLISATESLGSPVVSPDGKWVAYGAVSPIDRSIYVSPMTPGGGRTRVASGNVSLPRWSRDGKTLYYFASDDRLFAASLSFTERGVTVFQSALVAAASELETADVGADGKRIAGVILPKNGDSRIIVHTRWWQSVRDRVLKSR